MPGLENFTKQSLLQIIHCPRQCRHRHAGTNLPFGVNDFEQLKNACIDEKIDMVIVGPEEPLVNGIVDYLTNRTGN